MMKSAETMSERDPDADWAIPPEEDTATIAIEDFRIPALWNALRLSF